MLKNQLKELLLKSGLYYKINEYRFRNEEWGGAKDKSQRAFYASIISADDIVFDIGANVGQRTRNFFPALQKSRRRRAAERMRQTSAIALYVR